MKLEKEPLSLAALTLDSHTTGISSSGYAKPEKPLEVQADSWHNEGLTDDSCQAEAHLLSTEIKDGSKEMTSSASHYPRLPTKTESEKGTGQFENSRLRVSSDTDDACWRDPKEIPNHRPSVFVYPHQIIPQHYQEKYLEIVRFFRQFAESFLPLAGKVHFIDYTLKMCGRCREDARPSIIAFCRPQEFKPLKCLLESKQLRKQYCCKQSDSQCSWRIRFNLFFWRTQRPRELLWGLQSEAILNYPARPPLASCLTMCGSVLKTLSDVPRHSTLGYVICVGSEFYGVTASHSFRDFEKKPLVTTSLHTPIPNNAARNTSEDALLRSSASAVSRISLLLDHEMMDLDTAICDDDENFFVDDGEYDSMTDEEDFTMDGFSNTHSDEIRKIPEAMTQENIKTHILFPSLADSSGSGEADLDWALVRLDDPAQWRPNVMISQSEGKIRFLSSNFGKFPELATKVVVITASGIPVHGLLQPTISVLGGVNGAVSTVMRSMSLHDEMSLHRGDSGSVVVDAKTFDIYGHVVGSNPLGEVYISSANELLEHLRTRFPHISITLPEPEVTLKNLVSHHNARGHSEAVAQLKVHLAEAREFQALESPSDEAISSNLTRSMEAPPLMCPSHEERLQWMTGMRQSPRSELSSVASSKPKVVYSQGNPPHESNKKDDRIRPVTERRIRNAKSTAGLKRLKPQLDQGDDQDEYEDEGEDTGEGGGNNRPRPGADEGNSNSLTLACPYFKKDPRQYAPCSGMKLTRIRDVKQHLHRRHLMPLYCAVCYRTFTEEMARDAHTAEMTCQRGIFPRPEGINQRQQGELRKRANRQNSTEEQWFGIFLILFPEHELPQTPYIDANDFATATAYQEFVMARGVDILNNTLTERGATIWNVPPGPQREAFQRRILRDGLTAIFNAWRSQDALSEDMDAASSSSAVPNSTLSSLGESLEYAPSHSTSDTWLSFEDHQQNMFREFPDLGIGVPGILGEDMDEMRHLISEAEASSMYLGWQHGNYVDNMNQNNPNNRNNNYMGRQG